MKFIIALILSYIFVKVCKKSIKKAPQVYYVIATLLAVITAIQPNFPQSIDSVFVTLFYYGSFSTALFTLVMYMNAVKNGSKFQKEFMVLRGELSIIACILAFGHNIHAGRTYFVWLFVEPERFTRDTELLLATVITLVLIALMVPLFITSFRLVRKKMEPKKWKKLQRWSYVFYMLIYYHIILLMVPVAYRGDKTYQLNVLVYTTVFLTYAFLRLAKEYKKSRDKKWVVCLVVLLVFTTTCFIVLNPHDEGYPKAIEMEEKGDLEQSAEEFMDEMSLRYPGFRFSDYEDGAYEGRAEGYHGLVTVTATIVDGALESLTLDHHFDDRRYMNQATMICEDILLDQSLEVDAITGATFSSKGIIDATYNALAGSVLE